MRLTEEFLQVTRTKDSEVQGWLTQSQIAKLYVSEMLVSEIVKSKRPQPGMSMPHPEIPDVEAARLFVGEDQQYQDDRHREVAEAGRSL